MFAGRLAAGWLLLGFLGCATKPKLETVSKNREWVKAVGRSGASFTHSVKYSLVSPYLLPHDEEIAWLNLSPKLPGARVRVLVPLVPDVACFVQGREGEAVAENLLEFFPSDDEALQCRIRLGSTTLQRTLPVTYEVLLPPPTASELEEKSLPRIKKTLRRLDKLNVMDVHQLQQIPLDVLGRYHKRLWVEEKTEYLSGAEKGDYLVFLGAGGKFQTSTSAGKVFGAMGLGRQVPGLQSKLPRPEADAFSLGCFGVELGRVFSAAEEFKSLVRLKEKDLECGLNLSQDIGRSWVYIDYLHIPPAALKEDLLEIIDRSKAGLYEWQAEWSERKRLGYVSTLERRAAESRKLQIVLEPQIRELNLLLERSASEAERRWQARNYYQLARARRELDQSSGEVEKRGILRGNYLRKLSSILPETTDFEGRLTGLNVTMKPLNLLGRLAYIIQSVNGEYAFKGAGILEGAYHLLGGEVGDIFITKRRFDPRASVLRYRFCPVSFYTRDALPSALRSLKRMALPGIETLTEMLRPLAVTANHTCTPVVLKPLSGELERFEAFDQCFLVRKAKEGWELSPWRAKARYSSERVGVELKAILTGGEHVSSLPLRVVGETFIPGDEYCASVDEL